MEDNTDFDPDFEETDQSTDGEGEAPEEQAPEETFQSKSGDSGLHPPRTEVEREWKTS